VRKRNIDWLSGVLFVDPRIREGWVFHDLQVKHTDLLDKWFKLLTEDLY
jgi:hypothetical protein